LLSPCFPRGWFPISQDRCKATLANRAARQVAFAVLAVLMSIAAAGCRSRTALTPEQEAGKHLYDVRCAHCHEENDLALKKIPPDLHGIFRRPALPSGLPVTDQNIERAVLSGKGMMPSFAGRFTGEQMSALLDYLHAGIR